MPKCYIPDYPRPQFVRPEWESLNGTWSFAFDDKDEGVSQKWFEKFPEGKSILVPFSYETAKSGIGDESFPPVIWYSRAVSPKRESGKRVVLHFEGSDFLTRLWVNGRFAGEHRGGYTRFSFDITELLEEGENVLTVRAEDSNDTMQPRGKQRWKDKNFGCWYVQTTGIWKTVWLEYLPETHIERVKMTPVLAEKSLELQWQVSARHYGFDLTLTAEISYEGKLVNRVTFPVPVRRGKARINVCSQDVHEWGLMAWHPRQPNLYDIKFELAQGGKTLDAVGSYFGMRSIRIDGSMILLNEEPLYQRLILDQGYWEESHLTPPDEAALVEDIDKILAMGFNGERKHQKIEDEQFAYWCDVKGLLLWCEMPSPYEFGDDMEKSFTEEWRSVVEQHYNHPSIITWTPFNESWGIAEIKTDRPQQHFTEAVYHLTKAIDPMRPVIVNDGWEHTVSDIITLHDYEELGTKFLARYTEHKDDILGNRISHNNHKAAFADGYAYRGQPVILSEYGGAAFSGGEKGAWGYGNTVATVEQYLARIDDMTSAIRALGWICGYCYTQATDVQQEINGLMNIRREYKADVNQYHEIFSQFPFGRA